MLFAVIIIALLFISRNFIAKTLMVFLIFGSVMGILMMFDGRTSSNTMREAVARADVMTVSMEGPRPRGGNDEYRRAALTVNNTTQYQINDISVDCTGIGPAGNTMTLNAYTHASVSPMQTRSFSLEFSATAFEDGDFSADRCVVQYQPEEIVRKDGMWSRS